MMGMPNIFSLLMICVWPAVAVALFALMPPRRALAVGFVLGWLFLPQLPLPLPFVKWDKHTATSVGAVLGVLIFDAGRLRAFRPTLVDLPMAVWCFVPFSSAMANAAAGLTPYDACASAATQITIWGVPYVLGRCYYSDFLGLRGLAVWVFVGGVIYVPFCLFEKMISPQLHFMTYGFYQHDFQQVIRDGGYRPMVFMEHGLAVGMMLTAASLAGIWLWWTNALPTLFRLPVVVPLVVLLATTAAIKSTGAVALLVLGVGVIFTTRAVRTYALVVVLCVIPFVYMAARSVGGWDGQNIMDVVEQATERERALSLQCRFDNENELLKKAMQKPVFGWGPNGRNLVTADDGSILSIPDGLWVIAVGANGIVGLIALFGALLVPVILVKRRFRAGNWSDPQLSGVACFAVIITLHAIDNLMNAMLNPIFVLGLGGLAGIVANVPGGGASPGRMSAGMAPAGPRGAVAASA